MEIKIIKEKENPFFKRKDLTIEIFHKGKPTPKTSEVVKEIASKFGVDESQVIVDYILTKSGFSESNAKVKVLNEKPPKVEQPKEVPKEPEPTEQSPAEEKTEEHKEDVKDEAQTPEGE